MALRLREEAAPPVDVAEIDRLIAERRAARRQRDFATADRIRGELDARGRDARSDGEVAGPPLPGPPDYELDSDSSGDGLRDGSWGRVRAPHAGEQKNDPGYTGIHLTCDLPSGNDLRGSADEIVDQDF